MKRRLRLVRKQRGATQPARAGRRSSRARAAGARPGRGPAPAAVVAVAALALAGLFALGAHDPRVALAVPGLAPLLDRAASVLPRGVAWVNDSGSARLRSGAYLGWSDGAAGELFLYGEGCSSVTGHDELTWLALSGRAGRLAVPLADVEQRWGELDHARSHPYLRVRLVTDRTLEFDRAALRCRSGAEATARIAARVVHVEQLQPPARDSAPTLHLASFPGVGLTGELSLATRDAAVTLTAIEYAPAGAATGTVRAAAGRPASRELWRSLVRADEAAQETELQPPHPWHAAYQSPDAPRALRPRSAAALDLTLGPREAGMIFLQDASFRATPGPRPLLLTPVLRYESSAGKGAVVVEEPAFGWTPRP